MVSHWWGESEEQGDVSAAIGGELIPLERPSELAKLVREVVGGQAGDSARRSIGGSLRWMKRWPQALASLGIFIALWFVSVAGSVPVDVVLAIPVRIENLPPSSNWSPSKRLRSRLR